MARDENDREDLLREATALVERIELRVIECATATASILDTSTAGNIVVGFRLGGALSIFFGGDPVYQFNAAGQLRRAYFDGRIYKSWHGRLVSLERRRTPHEVQLIRSELTDDEQNTFITRMTEHLREFTQQLSGNALEVIGQMPPETDILPRVRGWFSMHNGLPIAESPGVAST